MWNVTLQISIVLAFHTQYSALYKSEEIISIGQNYNHPPRNITKVATRNSFEHYKKILQSVVSWLNMLLNNRLQHLI